MAPKKKLKFYNKGNDVYFSEPYNTPNPGISSSLEDYGAVGGGESNVAMESEFGLGPSTSSSSNDFEPHPSHYPEERPAPPSSESQPPQRKKKQQCRMCANHNLQVDMKGHKHFCPYAECECEFCEITKMRQLYMKKQQQITRRQQQQQQQFQMQSQSPFAPVSEIAGPSSEEVLGREFPPSRRQEMERDLANIDDEPLLEKINELCKTRGRRH